MKEASNFPDFTRKGASEPEPVSGVLGAMDLHQIIDSVRASSFVMKEIARKNHEIKSNADAMIALLQSELLSERKKSSEFEQKFNELTQKLNEVTINSFEERNIFGAKMDELKEANNNLADTNRLLLEELQKAHAWLDLIYSTAATELQVTLDNLENPDHHNP